MKRIIASGAFCILLTYILSVSSCTTTSRYPGPLSPEESLKEIEVDNRFEVELYAAEPLVKDPVSMVFDGQGGAWVVEMPDYPYKPEPGQGKGRIVHVLDVDGDGRADSSRVFAEGIADATTVLPWKGGLIVTAAPNILYLKDTDGDGVSDSREVLFTGFFENNSEAQITSLRFGVDNWIYASNNGQAGTVGSPAFDGDSLSMAGHDFRFRMDRGEFELETGRGQFGAALDDWGHRYFTQNTIHIRQVVIADRYVSRNPYLPPVGGIENISDHELEMYQIAETPYWRTERSRQRQEKYDEQGSDRIEWAEGHFTGASGGTFYGGDAYPDGFYGNIFTGDVSGNLVHRDVLSVKDGSPVMVASRAEGEEKKEFLASRDTWFRPAGFAVGPDGCLYVIDMYRQHIETPVSIPDDLKADMDFMAGSDKGRIYRVVPKDGIEAAPKIEAEGTASAGYYVKLLSHSNRWWRLYGQRRLLELQDKSVVPAVRELFEGSEDARVRLHALYVLEGLGALDAGLAAAALKDVEAGVREHGAVLSERYPENISLLAKALDDSSARVAFQAALSLGEFPSAATSARMADFIVSKGEGEWFQTAVLSSASGSSPSFLKSLTVKGFFEEATAARLSFLEDYAYVQGNRNAKGDVSSLLAGIKGKGNDWELACMKGLSKGLSKSKADVKNTSELRKALEAFAASSTDEVKKVLKSSKLLD